MTTRRNTDAHITPTHFRSDRVVQDSGKWFFLTREGTLQGPFECRMDAVEQLDVYIRLALNDLLLENSPLSLQAQC